MLKKARQAGIKTNIELCSIPAEELAQLARPCLPHLDYIIVNDYEAGAVAGIATSRDGATDQAACAEAAKAILAAGSVTLAIVHYPDGCIAATRDGQLLHKPSVRVPSEAVVGVNGAGDAFAAGMLFAIHEGVVARRGVSSSGACAAPPPACAPRRRTGSVGLDWRACLALAAEWGWRDGDGAL